jgi:replicative superfamily II helicase
VAASRQIQVCLYGTILEIAQEASVRARGKKSLFFCQSRSLSESVAERMRGRGAEVFVHHSSVSRDERREAEARFHHGTDAAIVCTSTLELGIDVGDLDLVFQANAPSTVSSFMQRMGRTGRRAGQVANTTFLCESPEDVLQAVAIVELARKGWVESVPVQDRCWPVLVHQILAQTLQFGAISAERCFEQLARVPDFRGITPAERTHLIEHLTKEEYLFESGGLLSMGTKAERIFGRKNFSELYAVFSSPVLYRVETETGRDLGSLDQDFADRLVEEMSSFLLGGRAWTVVRLDHKERTVVVREAPAARSPAGAASCHNSLASRSAKRCDRSSSIPSSMPTSIRHHSQPSNRGEPTWATCSVAATHRCPARRPRRAPVDVRRRPDQPHPEVRDRADRRVEGGRRQLRSADRGRRCLACDGRGGAGQAAGGRVLGEHRDEDGNPSARAAIQAEQVPERAPARGGDGVRGEELPGL